MDNRTNGIVEDVVRKIAEFVKENQLQPHEIEGIVFIGNTFTNQTFTRAINNRFIVDNDKIVIYREVDGVITPDPASSDTTIPTFSASDTNIKTGGTIGKIQGTLGTPDTIGGSTTTYSYTI